MMPLQGGPVLPSYLDHLDERPPTAEYGNTALRSGEVVELIWPDDPRSLSKRVLEYRVRVQHADDGGAATTREYSNCVLLNGFGSVADRATWTLRPGGSASPEGLGKGAKVVLACLNGESASGVILGALRDEHETLTDTDTRKTLGDHFLSWRFNGIHTVVAADGTFSLNHYGPSNEDGIVPSEQLKRSGFTMAPDGSLLLGARNDPNGSANQLIRVNQPDRKIELVAGNGVHLGTATDKMLLGSTYREAQGAYHDAVQLLLNLVEQTLGTISDALQSIATSMAIPLVGPVLAAPQIAAVAAQVKILKEIANKCAEEIEQFERGKGPKYLSEVHKVGAH